MEDNIVFFPKLKDRIVNLGKKALEEKDFSKALMLCNQLKEMNEHNSQTELAAVACLLEGNRAKEARARCEELVFGPFESDEAIEVYISILFQLKEYEELQKSIKKLLVQKRIDENQMDKFQAMLSLSKKVTSDRDGKQGEILDLKILVENSGPLNKQLELINELRMIDCTLVLKQIEDILKSPKANSLIQSFILFILQEQSVDKDFELNKVNQRMIWNATNQNDNHKSFVDAILNKLSNVLESEDPSAFEIAKAHFQHFMTIYFPFIPIPSDENIWAACFYYIVQEFFDRKMTEDELNDLFNVEYFPVQSAISLVRRFEAEGYFDIK
ncbi:tetratricopeptide repeat protein [Gottfriedia luciferensis]|uniref:tetratricopeptide repeat protein n=1 Tax=Gottfriedia luciferensis TaxID=178774 RepID=UPI000B43B8FA|nr:tetratricopeptide repeat protein [Gottfriedia luciferensis]